MNKQIVTENNQGIVDGKKSEGGDEDTYLASIVLFILLRIVCLRENTFPPRREPCHRRFCNGWNKFQRRIFNIARAYFI